MNKYQFDKFIKTEVESIDFDGAQEAWEMFDASRNKEIKPKPVPVFTLWKPLAAAASVAVFCGILLHQSLVDDPGLIAENEFASVENISSDIENAISVKVNDDLSRQKLKDDVRAEVVQSESIQERETLKINTQNQKQSEVVNNQIATESLSHSQSKIDQKTLRTTISKSAVNTYEKAQVLNQPDVVFTLTSNPVERDLPIEFNRKIKNTNFLPLLSSFAALDVNLGQENLALGLAENLVKNKRRKMKFFAELGIGNRQAGKHAIVGVSIPKDSWSLEAGLGLNDKGNSPIEYTDVIESNIEEYYETHRYKFAQKLNAIFPLKIRKRLGKRHAILVGAQGSYNLSNQVNISSTVPVRASSFGGVTGGGFNEVDVDYYDINYKYSNANSVINSFGIVSSNRWNLDLTAGYEFNIDRIAIGVNVMRPVFSTFSVSKELSSPVSFKIKEQARLNLSLKYYLG